jgi:DNA-binding beta-propeller fold protein YncE
LVGEFLIIHERQRALAHLFIKMPTTRKLALFWLLACVSLVAQEAEIPVATSLSGRPFAIRNTWFIGGVGSWDYLTMDANAQRLFIAHGSTVQIVDVKTGAPAGEISGLRDAHTIVFDSSGNYGYISDGGANNVKVFDRGSLQIIATIPTIPSPRSLVFDPRSDLLFAVCTPPPGPQGGSQASCGTDLPQPRRDGQPRAEYGGKEVGSSIAVLSADTRTVLGEILLPSKLGFAIGDQNGHVYINMPERNQVLRLGAEAIATLLRARATAASSAEPEEDTPQESNVFSPPAILDWTHGIPAEADVSSFSLPGECKRPVALAIDGKHFRLFGACENWKLVVLNTITGASLATLTTGPGTDAIAYDPSRELIFSANGGGYGSLTVIQQNSNTDSYAVTQVLPTRERARTLAVDSSSGDVYLVTDYKGVDLDTPAGIGTMKTTPVSGSFQVIDINR